jgi:hypothetical protein
MLIVLYRWRLNPEKESQFIEAWTEITDYYRKNWNSLGSRLHLGSDGMYYGYAQWKSAEHRKQAFQDRSQSKAGQNMKDAVIESFPEIILEKLSDFLILPEKF